MIAETLNGRESVQHDRRPLSSGLHKPTSIACYLYLQDPAFPAPVPGHNGGTNKAFKIGPHGLIPILTNEAYLRVPILPAESPQFSPAVHGGGVNGLTGTQAIREIMKDLLNMTEPEGIVRECLELMVEWSRLHPNATWGLQ